MLALRPPRMPESGYGARRPSLFESTKWFPEHVADWLDRNSRVFLLTFSTLYLIGATLIASHRSLWADEVLTAYMARLSLPQLWSALKAGTDIEPPLFHLITRAFTSVFGQSPLALRMPAIVGGLLMCLSLYVFVARRLRPLYGAVAMLMPFATGASDYTYQARCYGIALGFSGAALVCWQGATERRRRKLSLIGLSLCLGAAIACQYYMVLMLAAIGLGEIVRSASEGEMDLPVWMALTAAILPLPFHWPLIRAAMTFTGGDWSMATAGRILPAYHAFLAQAMVPFAAIAVGLAVGERFWSAGSRPAKSTARDGVPVWEVVAGLALVCSLGGAFLLARLTNGIFTFRYAICMVFGFALLPVWVIRRYDSARPLAGVISVGVLAGCFLAHELIPDQGRFQTPPLLLSAAHSSSAIAIENPLDFLELVYNAPPEVASRVRYIVSRQDSIRYTGTDDDERELLLLRRWFPIRTEALQDFLKQHKRFPIWRGTQARWLVPYLLDHGATIALTGTSDSGSLFIATPGRGAR